MSSKGELVLPLGNIPFWDQKRSAEEETELKSVSESCVLLQSLKQSRERWLFKTFPRFSSRSRGNKDPAPPPHTIQTRGRCDLVIGPHIFPDTVFYEVHYLPPQGSQPSSFSTQPLAANPYWQSSSSYTSSYPQNVTAGSSTQTPQTDSTTVATPVKGVSSSLNSIPSSITLTPNLIQQVNSAASSNPILANLLQIAAAGKATQDQLKTLGLLIQSFATLSSTSSTTQAQLAPSTFLSLGSYQRASILPLVKEFDLVFEFHETPNDRWFIPRVPIYTERKPPPDQPNDLDISLLTCVPFNADKTSQTEGQTTTENPVQYPVTFVLKNAPFTIWETIWRWIGGEDKNKANKVELESQVSPPRLYPGYQLPPGQLLTQFQAACAPPYSMKTLKQGPSAQNRTARQKRTKKDTGANATEKPNGVEASGDTVVVKRARLSHSKSTPPVPIQCLTCKNADVPLILGGKYCRPCAEIEKQKANNTSAETTPVLTELSTT